MRNKLVYDWPTRIFHWTFALGFVLAYAIAKTQDEDSFRFPVHMLIGLGWSALTGFPPSSGTSYHFGARETVIRRGTIRPRVGWLS